MNERTITLEGLKHAQQVYKDKEYRELVYRAATALVDLALRNQINLTVAEALAVLLQSWNKAYYEFRPFTKEHLAEIARLVESPALDLFRDRPIEELCPQDEAAVKTLFGDFQQVLGPVGAAKSLHLLAHRFFPLWDNAIAEHYGFRLGHGRNVDCYWKFMARVKEQVQKLGGEDKAGPQVLKALDEYNYCTMHDWL